MSNPFFSVIVPVYNVEKYLAECIESILNQTFADFELILVDDGSTDNSPQICDGYAGKDQRIKVVHKRNGGHTSARKAGATIATGEYVVTVDSDDWIAKDLLKLLYDTVNKGSLDAVCYNYYTAGDKLVQHKSKYAEGLYTENDIERIKEGFLYDSEVAGLNGGTVPYSIWTKAVKRNLYWDCQQLVPDDISKGEDLIFSLNLFERCDSIYMLDYFGYYYRTNQASIVHNYSIDDIKKLNRLVKLILIFDDYRNAQNANKAYVYACITFWNLIAGIARQMEGVDEFVEFARKEFTVDFENYFNKVRLAKYTIKDWLKLFLVRNEQWKLIYWYMNRTNG